MRACGASGGCPHSADEVCHQEPTVHATDLEPTSWSAPPTPPRVNVTTGEDKPFADRINAIPKIVFSTTLDDAPWGEWNNATVESEDPARTVAQLKRQSGKDMVIWGSISLGQSLMQAGLIDQLQLIMCPVVLGRGKPLFATATRRQR
jgi:dihydrofolate reductase